MGLSEIFQVDIVFSQSHLFFPQIIHWILLIMVLAIVVLQGLPYLRAVRSGDKQLPFVGKPFDGLRFFGTLVLTVAYFLLMSAVGELFPNTGFGFLLMSIPYTFVLSLLYMHQRDVRHLLLIAVISLVAPVIAWYVLGHLFNITLP